MWGSEVGRSGCYGMGRALEVLCSEGKGVSWWERVDLFILKSLISL
jgi:hypothetical protein